MQSSTSIPDKMTMLKSTGLTYVLEEDKTVLLSPLSISRGALYRFFTNGHVLTIETTGEDLIYSGEESGQYARVSSPQIVHIFATSKGFAIDSGCEWGVPISAGAEHLEAERSVASSAPEAETKPRRRRKPKVAPEALAQ